MAKSSYIESAFNVVCDNPTTPDLWYVALVESVPYYGGSEEGGWWGRDTKVIAWKEFMSQDLASAAAARVEKMASEMAEEALRNYGNQCLHEIDWLESRGLDADYLPEPDGPSEYRVIVSQELPEPSRGTRQYS